MKRFLSVAVVAAAACLPAVEGSAPPRGEDLLSAMGFALTDDGDATTPAGTLEATFDAPVISYDETLAAPGTAHVTFDDVARDIGSACIIGAYEGTDIAYVVLFQTDAPWRYVIVAAHESDLVAGNSIAFDGTNAAALTVDEVSGSGYLATSGSLSITAANVESGGTLSGALTADLSEVALETWPEDLFPLYVEGDDATSTLHATASGTFAAIYTLATSEADAPTPGSADVTVAVEGFDTFHGVRSFSVPFESGMTAIVIEDVSSTSALVITAPDASVIAGSTSTFDGYATGAWLLSVDGSQLALTTGTLHFDSVELAEGGTVSGSINSDGDAWFLPPDSFSDDEWEEAGPSCVGIVDAALAFVPTGAFIEVIDGVDGYEQALTLADDGFGSAIAILLPFSIDLDVSTSFTYDLSGTGDPDAFFLTAACDQPELIESGMLVASLDVATDRLAGSIAYVVAGQNREVTFDLPAEVFTGAP